MRIAFFAECYDPQINGVVTCIKNLENLLKEKGHQVYKFVPKISRNQPELENDIFRQKSIKYPFQKEYNIASLNSKKIIKLAQKWQIELIHAHGEFFMFLNALKVKKKMNVPLVFTFHTFWENYKHYFFWGLIPTFFIRLAFKYLYRKIDYFIAPSEKAKYYLKNILHMPQPVEVIPSGLNLDHFYPKSDYHKIRNEFRKKYNLSDKDFVFIHVGRIGKEKSIDQIIKAFPEIIKKYPSAKLIIVGDGPAKNDLQKLTTSLNLNNNIFFLGYIPWQKINEAYYAADAFVFASETETQGLVVIEAMAAKLPIIIKNDLAFKGIVQENVNALIFHNQEELVEKTFSLISDKKRRESLAIHSFELSKNFTNEKFVGKIEKLYQNILIKTD